MVSILTIEVSLVESIGIVLHILCPDVPGCCWAWKHKTQLIYQTIHGFEIKKNLLTFLKQFFWRRKGLIGKIQSIDTNASRMLPVWPFQIPACRLWSSSVLHIQYSWNCEQNGCKCPHIPQMLLQNHSWMRIGFLWSHWWLSCRKCPPESDQC